MENSYYLYVIEKNKKKNETRQNVQGKNSIDLLLKVKI